MSERARDILLLTAEIWPLIKKHWDDAGEGGKLTDNEIFLSLAFSIQNFSTFLYKMQYENKTVEEIEEEAMTIWGKLGLVRPDIE